MKRTLTCFALLTLLATPALVADSATTADPAASTQAEASTQPPAERVADGGLGEIGGQSACEATAQCQDGSEVSCEGSNQCHAYDQDCAGGERGYVECDGNKTYCPGPSECSCGDTRWLQTEQCCYGLHLWKFQRCQLSGWTDTGTTDCLVACDGSGGI